MKKEKDLFEDFTTLRWVKWTKRKPNFNGSVYIRWKGKYTSLGITHNGELMKLDGDSVKYEVKKQKLIMKYTKNQKELMKDMYWQEEIVNGKAYTKYIESL